jgi:2-polyprenyl-3-methyl-5-hydroxy-6-metoxy-1,4-benzoquinol methylase
MRSFAARSTEPEWMDGDDVTNADFAALIHDLAKVNTVLLARRPTLKWLARATRGLDHFSLVDVGSGEGDMLRAVHTWATGAGKTCALTGVDLNPRSEAAARAATDPAQGIDYITGDVFDYRPVKPPDFIISAICTHHMTNAQIVQFLRWIDATAVKGWYNNDLRRHWFAYYGFGLLACVARWHPTVVHDGQISVARSFTRAEWEALIDASGIPRAGLELTGEFLFRLCLGRIR